MDFDIIALPGLWNSGPRRHGYGEWPDGERMLLDFSKQVQR